MQNLNFQGQPGTTQGTMYMNFTAVRAAPNDIANIETAHVPPVAAAVADDVVVVQRSLSMPPIRQ